MTRRLRPTAAVLTVGSELVTGLRVDTNTAEVARALTAAGYTVREAISVGDDAEEISRTLARLVAEHYLVLTTGGLGPTHDDVTREAAASALGLAIHRDPEIERLLAERAAMHRDPGARVQVLRQADVLEGATVIPASAGTAPGQIVPTPAGKLVLLPGPPVEMRPMLHVLATAHPADVVAPAVVRLAGITESDAQMAVERTIAGISGVTFGLLATPGLVDVVLTDGGGGPSAVADAESSVLETLGEYCYSTHGASLEEAVVGLAISSGRTLATAESCTGGMVAVALTSVPGASAAVKGSIVAYANEAKHGLLGVSTATLDSHGAVSAETAREMATGAAGAFGADIALAITGIAGPDGGTADKPVGLVWFALASGTDVTAWERRLPGDRDAIRLRATVHALDRVRRVILGLPAS